MPSALTYRGVYVDEIPSGVRTLTAVPASVTALIGRARKGPTNEAFEINSFGDFERTLGGQTYKAELPALLFARGAPFNSLCVPPYAMSADRIPENIGKDLMAATATLCEQRRAMLIVDSADTWKSIREAERS